MKFQLFFRLTICILMCSVLGIVLLPRSVLAAPIISIFPRAGAPGTQVIISGSNFTSYVGDRLFVFFNDVEIARIAVSVQTSGNFQVSFEVPAGTAPGDTMISIRSVEGTILAERVFTVIAPQVRLSTWAGTVLTQIQITARGFHAGMPVEFRYRVNDEVVNIGIQTTGDIGECSIQFTIPESPRGKHSIMASNSEGQRATAEFEIISEIAIEPKIAAVGDIVTIQGTGFTDNSQISISLYDEEVTTTQSTKSGSFNTQLVVPVVKAGTYYIAAKDVNKESKWEKLDVTSRINLNKDMGEVGAKLTLSGTGFEVNGVITINYDSQELGVQKADEIGAFSYSFTVPIGVAGVHIVTATDGVNLRQLAYIVESEPPSTPEPLSPRQYNIVTMPLVFDWEGVYDISQPLYYTLQISYSADFVNPVIDISDLISSQYTLGNGETLLPNRRGTYYYWRVRATDGASNIGEWSDAAVFRVKSVDILPAWARYLLIVVQAIIALFFAFRIWKAVANKGTKS